MSSCARQLGQVLPETAPLQKVNQIAARVSNLICTFLHVLTYFCTCRFRTAHLNTHPTRLDSSKVLKEDNVSSAAMAVPYVTEEQAWTTLRDRYNGYWWGKGEKVYNPWAILNSLRSLEFGSYWWSSGTPGALIDMADSLQRPDGDMEGIQTDDMSLLFDITRPKAEPLLWQSGYLTIKEASGQLYTLGFPNAEVREAWYGMMLTHFASPKGPSGSTTALIMLDALRRGDRPQFEKALTALFAAIPYNLHTKDEAYYHSIFFAVIKAIGGDIIPEPSTSLGRADAVIETDKTIYITELKLGKAADALAQIEAKRYYEPWLTDPRPIILLAAGGFDERNIKCIWKELRMGCP
jgi:hypothetical protein